jgi:hypothetical protein
MRSKGMRKCKESFISPEKSTLERGRKPERLYPVPCGRVQPALAEFENLSILVPFPASPVA